MSAMQTANSTATKFSDKMQRVASASATKAKNLKMGLAVRNMLIWPIYAIPWLLGRVFYVLKLAVMFFYVAFRDGAKLEQL